MKFRNYLLIAFIGFCVIFSTSKNAFAFSSNNANIPTFNVTLNGILINNINSDYPLLTYKDITYFPLTWDYCRFLGLDCQWDQTSGLTINKTGQCFAYKNQEINSVINNMQTRYSVVIPSYPITINGQKIINNKENWPLINFRNITYFPLTWHFAAELFGWNYTWFEAGGLAISCPGGKSEDSETVLSLINQMAFGQVYSFNASITDLTSNHALSGYKGIHNNYIEYSNFISSINLITNPGTDKVVITGMNEYYQDFYVRKPNIGWGLSCTGVDPTPAQNRGIMPALQNRPESKMIINLLNLHFVGEERDNILSINKSKTDGGISTWKIITKNGTSSDKTIDVQILDSHSKVRSVKINDGSYLYAYEFIGNA
ncbi:MAG TPA: hypothetical protein DER33_03905 [Syntrophomonas sp.]|jgi:hypothetical protein|nr:hypothetical protein [Syntrophomonas sp.]HCF70728.1 hypothetical protein [Syntrophomonas sp.]